MELMLMRFARSLVRRKVVKRVFKHVEAADDLGSRRVGPRGNSFGTEMPGSIERLQHIEKRCRKK